MFFATCAVIANYCPFKQAFYCKKFDVLAKTNNKNVFNFSQTTARVIVSATLARRTFRFTILYTKTFFFATVFSTVFFVARCHTFAATRFFLKNRFFCSVRHPDFLNTRLLSVTLFSSGSAIIMLFVKRCPFATFQSSKIAPQVAKRGFCFSVFFCVVFLEQFFPKPRKNARTRRLLW